MVARWTAVLCSVWFAGVLPGVVALFIVALAAPGVRAADGPSEAYVKQREAAYAAWRSANPKSVLWDGPLYPEMVIVPAGEYTMGSPSDEADRDDDEGPQHRVTIGQPFALGKTEVTRGQFAAFVAETGHDAGNLCYIREGDRLEEQGGRNWRDPGFPQTDSHPVVCVNWQDARAYAEWLSRKTRKHYRLATEAEWEYAARAGTTTARYWGDNPSDACAHANVADQFTKREVPGTSGWTIHECSDNFAYTAPAGSFPPNAFGLHDMLGNAWEWTEDCYHKSYTSAPADGSAWTSGDCAQRVLRGSSWDGNPGTVRSAFRDGRSAANRYYSRGFRVARTD